MDTMLAKVASALDAEARALRWAESPLLLLIRLAWGVEFARTGWGKLGRIEEVAAWFGGDLGIPMPLANAYLAAGTELVGGVCLALGLGGRIVTAPLAFTMVVALATSDRAAVAALLGGDIDTFVTAAPTPYLLAALIVLVFGPGALSADALVARWWRSRAAAPVPATA